MTFKTRLKLSSLFRPLNTLLRGSKSVQWRLTGSPLPPLHEIKQSRLLRLQKRFGLKVFVETGTYRGKMVFAMRPYFSRIVTIELASELAQKAKQLFAEHPQIEVLHGDSADLLPSVLKGLDEPALFWLDGHFSGGETGKGDKLTPILEELSAVLSHDVSGHVIAIDDALCFTGADDYPTIDELREFVAAQAASYQVEVEDNIIYVTPS